MKSSNKLDKVLNGAKFHGVIQIFIFSFFIYSNLERLYNQKQTNILYFFIYSDWVLWVNIIGGLLGIFIAYKIFKGHFQIKYGYLFLFIIWVFDKVYVMF